MKNKHSAIIVTTITALGGIGVAYINGCFSSKAPSGNKPSIIMQKVDNSVQNNAPVQQQSNQTNHVSSSTQYNASRDINITQLPVQPLSTEKKPERNKRKVVKSKAKDPSVSIQENNGFVNVGGTGNTYNQTMNPKPEPRHFTGGDLQKINAALPPKDYKVEILFAATEEAETYAKEIGGWFGQNGYQTYLVPVYMLVAPPEPRFTINVNHDEKKIKIIVLKREG